MKAHGHTAAFGPWSWRLMGMTSRLVGWWSVKSSNLPLEVGRGRGKIASKNEGRKGRKNPKEYKGGLAEWPLWTAAGNKTD